MTGTSWQFALRGIRGNVLRSLLTMLGILIGVASVIVLLAVGAGSTAAVTNSLAGLGTQTLTVNRSENGNGRAGQVTRTGGGFGGGGLAGGLPSGGGAAGGFGAGGFGAGGFGAGGFGAGGFGAGGLGAAGSSNAGTRSQSTALTVSDAASLIGTSATSAVAAVAPVVSASSVTAYYTGVSEAVPTFLGTTPSYLEINNYSVQYGSPLTDSDYTGHRSVVLLGSTMAAELFGRSADAPGKTIQLSGKNFTVAGVLAAKGSSNNSDQDALVLAPLTTVADKFTGVTTSLSSISVRSATAADLDLAEAQIETVLDARHAVTSLTRDYTVVNQTAIIASATSSSKTLTVLLGAVAAISLLVGGIGVMNIMLVTVTERTREIGIRKAIGAQRSNIVTQFLIEAVLLSVLGALAGIALGLIGSRFTIVGVQPVVQVWSVGLAFAVAVVIGLFFGSYPAARAAGLSPIDALRYE